MSETRAVVLGAGRVGALIALDLAAEPGWRVTALDRDERALAGLSARGEVATAAVDLADPRAVRAALARADVVVGAAPGFLGLRALELAVETGRPVVDISFLPEDPRSLDAAARARGASVVYDCGVAPGLSNWFVGRSAAELERVEAVEIVVGGLPARRVWPFEYGAVFSPTDVIEEYVRPCRMREHGVDRVVPALSGIERIDLPHVGTLEAFLTDGLRSLLDTIEAPNLRERTLRYPGHAEKMLFLRETGFLERKPRRIGGVEVAPRALTEALLVDAWTLAEGEEEFTLLRVEVEGQRAGRRERHVWDLFDRTDRLRGATSMARTTGFPCAIMARMLVSGAWSHPGVVPPEVPGRDAALTERMLDELGARGIEITRAVRAV